MELIKNKKKIQGERKGRVYKTNLGIGLKYSCLKNTMSGSQIGPKFSRANMRRSSGELHNFQQLLGEETNYSEDSSTISSRPFRIFCIKVIPNK